MRLSRRITSIVPGAEDGWEVYYRARDMIEAGEPVVMLTIGDHDIATDRRILAAMQESVASGHTGYTPVEGIGPLREAVAARAARRAAQPARAEEVAIVPGGQAGLFASLMTALDPGESCVILDPYYATYAQTVRAAGGRPIEVPCQAGDGFQPDARAIEAALAPDTRAILINTPNNPTGAVYSRAALEALAALCRARDLWLISDEVYESQVWQGEHVSPRALRGMAERTLVVNSLSKSHGMTGFRMGWVLGPEEAVARICDLAIATTYGLPGFIQDAAAWALADEAAEAGLRARYAARREAALAALADAPGLRVSPPQGGMYLMLDIRATGLSGAAFADRLLEAERIAVMPGESFGAAAAGHVRVALTRPEEVLVPALRRLARLVEELSVGATA
jgi:arginine:pyruvate transaminase